MITLQDLAIFTAAAFGILALVILSAVMSHRYIEYTHQLKRGVAQPDDPILDDDTEKKG